MAITRDDWDALLATLQRHTCGCGSTDVQFCADDCPGDVRDVAMVAALQTIIVALRAHAPQDTDPMLIDNGDLVRSK